MRSVLRIYRYRGYIARILESSNVVKGEFDESDVSEGVK